MNEGEKSWTSKLTLLVIIMFVIAGGSCFLWYKSATNPRKDALDKTITAQKTELAVLKGRQKKVTPQAINKEIERDNINVKEKLSEVESRINKGFTAVYSQTKTDEDYEKLKDTLPNLVGDSLSDKLLEIDKPVVNQSGKGQVTFDNLDSLDIAFGEYDIESKKIDGVIVADYTTPKRDTASAGQEPKYVVNKGQSFFKIQLDLAKNTIQLNDYENQVKEGATGE